MITIGIFAYNEEANLGATMKTLLTACQMVDEKDFEIIMVNDGSTDRTLQVMESLRLDCPAVRVINHEKNTGIGTSIAAIVQAARGDHVCFIPGDDLFSLFTMKQILLNVRKADAVLHYHINTEERQRARVVLSTAFTLLYRMTFGLNVIYINCAGAYSTELLRSIDILCCRHAVGAELNVKALLRGCTFYEVGGYMKARSQKSSAMRINNWIDVFLSFIRLVYEVKFRHRALYSSKPVRVIDEG